MLDNIADLLLTVSLLVGVFGFPTNVALRYMVPGTAIGVLAGDLMFFWLAFRLTRQTGRNGVTAMPLGLDTPSTFGMVFFVLGPAFLAAKSAGISSGLLEDAAVQAAAIHTWHIGICSIFISGLFKFACALGSGWIRRLLPRARIQLFGIGNDGFDRHVSRQGAHQISEQTHLVLPVLLERGLALLAPGPVRDQLVADMASGAVFCRFTRSLFSAFR